MVRNNCTGLKFFEADKEKYFINKTKFLMVFALLFSVLSLISSQTPAKASNHINLGTASSFVLLASNGLTNSGTTIGQGDIGSYPNITQTGFGSVSLTGDSINQFGNSVTQSALVDIQSAKNVLDGLTPTATIPNTLTTQTFAPGVYKSTNVLSINGTVTLDGGGNPNALFVFQTLGLITANTTGNIALTNGANQCNVYWVSNSPVPLLIGSSTLFRGTVITTVPITVGQSTSILGRLFSLGGGITTNSNYIYRPTCGTPPSATLTVVKRVINTHPLNDGSHLHRFNLIIGPTGQLGSGTTSNVANNGTTGPVIITAGANYNVSESAGIGGTDLNLYTTIFTGACSSTGIVNLAANTTGTCTITNTYAKSGKATLTVIKLVIPSAENLNKFNLIIGPSGQIGSGTTPNVGDLGAAGPVTISSGVNYNVSESAGTGGTNLSEYTTTFTGACSSTGVVNLVVNTTGTCTITNTLKNIPPVTSTLTVIKRVIPSVGNLNKFNLIISGALGPIINGTASNVGDLGTTGPVVITSGVNYNVSETAGNGGTNLSDYTVVFSGACSLTGVVNLVAGSSGTCTITNTLKNIPPVTSTLTVIKRVIPSVGNLNKFNLIISGALGPIINGTASNVGDLGTTGPVVITSGVNYNVSETAGNGGTNLSDYTVVFSGACSLTGVVNLVAGSSGTCTITNTLKNIPPVTSTLTVIKRVIPSVGNLHKFNLIIAGPSGSLGNGTTLNVGDLGSSGVVTITAGVNYNVSETAGNGGTNLSDYTVVFSGACSLTGVVNLVAGSSGTCTITNTLKNIPPPEITSDEPTQIPRRPIGYVRTDSGSDHGTENTKYLDQPAPVKISIPAIKVLSRNFMKVGFDNEGWMEVPKTGFAVAWFTGSPSPGEYGPSIIIGHVDMNKKPGVFYKLRFLKKGDLITITRADGKVVKYGVTETKSYLKKKFPSDEVYGDIDHEGLRLITCGGEFDKKKKQYKSNIIVFAKMIT